jgi:hypothetical protein
MVKAAPGLEGVQSSDQCDQKHLFSGFVDDTAVFQQKGAQISQLLKILQEFGEISGLHVQPSKSAGISLAKGTIPKLYHSIPMLAEGDTVRYLGIQVGLGDLALPNWMLQLSKLARRLKDASRYTCFDIQARATNTVPTRVAILNAVVLPAILFTAKFFLPPQRSGKTDTSTIWKLFVERTGGSNSPHEMAVAS